MAPFLCEFFILIRRAGVKSRILILSARLFLKNCKLVVENLAELS